MDLNQAAKTVTTCSVLTIIVINGQPRYLGNQGGKEISESPFFKEVIFPLPHLLRLLFFKKSQSQQGSGASLGCQRKAGVGPFHVQ